VPAAMVIGLVLHAGDRPRFAEAARTLRGGTVAWAVYEREDETDPSGRRLIRKLRSSRPAGHDGKAQPHRKGRPTPLYRLAITRALGRS
jgi:hypothetical protein